MNDHFHKGIDISLFSGINLKIHQKINDFCQ